MRAKLDTLYQLSGAVAGVGIVLICITILFRVTGRWFGIVIPSSDDIAGYLLASSSFLALAYTFRSGSHIRVALFLQRLNPRVTLHVERLVLIFASLLVSYLCYHLSFMVWESWLFEEVTHGYIPLPLWIVQLPMAVGATIFSLSIIDTTVRHFLGLETIPTSEEENLIETTSIDLDLTAGESK
jgi:TRAP-type C4-dicarboxylate transport system permease small subunit